MNRSVRTGKDFDEARAKDPGLMRRTSLKLALSSGWRMSALPSLLGGKPTLGELPEKDAHDRKPASHTSAQLRGSTTMR
jgi:hypothetical protein